LRLEHNTERKTNQNTAITSDEKLKRDCFLENGCYYFNRKSQSVSDTLPKKESKIILKNRPKLNQRESASH
jgi:hypothetical protein